MSAYLKSGIAVLSALSVIAVSLGMHLIFPGRTQANTTQQTAFAIVGSIDVPDPQGIAVSSDDTVYVVNGAQDTLTVINPGRMSGPGNATINVGSGPSRVAVDPQDDTVYVTNTGSNNLTVIDGRTNTQVGLPIPTGLRPMGIVVSPLAGDDTVYVATASGNYVTYAPRTGIARNVAVGPIAGITAYDLAVSPNDDTVYGSTDVNPTAAPCTSMGFSCFAVLNGATDDTALVGGVSGLIPTGVTADDDTVYGLTTLPALWAMNARTLAPPTRIVGTTLGDDGELGRGLAVNQDDSGFSTLAVLTTDRVLFYATGDMGEADDTVSFPGGGIGAIAAADGGVFWVGSITRNIVSALAVVDATNIAPTTAPPGSTVSITITPVTANLTVNDATIQSVSFGNTVVTGWTRVGSTFSAPAPAGTGTVDVNVNLNGGQTINAGTFSLQQVVPPPAPNFPPTQPRNLTATAGDTVATLTWTQPVSAGTFPIEAYIVTSSPTGGTCEASADARTCIVTGLTNGTTYTFTARAINRVGPSPASAPSNAVTPAARPSPPRNVVAVARHKSATLTWSEPSDSGTYPVTGYILTSSPAGGTCATDGAARTCTVTGLTNGTTYTFTATATNLAGTSAPSAPSNSVTPQARRTIRIKGVPITVNGRPGIRVNGTTTGLAPGTRLRPWLRFPGQSGHTRAAAVITVGQTGSFTWQRRTGKRVSVIVRTADGAVSSNRITIAAGR